MKNSKTASTRTAELRDAVNERHRAEGKFQLVVESAPNAMVMIDRDGRIILVNAQTEKLFGYSRDELANQPVELLVPTRFRNAHPEYRNGFFANPTSRSMGSGRDLYGQRKDGSEFPVEIGLTPIDTEEGLLVLARSSTLPSGSEPSRNFGSPWSRLRTEC